MKKTFFLIFLFVWLVLPVLSQKDNTEVELARTQEYINATIKQGEEKIAALQAYIKKFPETTQRWTKLAYYSMAIEYFQVKKFDEAVKYAKQLLSMGAPGKGEEARLYLVIGNSYGVKGSAVFSNEEALKYTSQALEFAAANGFKDVVEEARNLKEKLSGPPPKQLTPEQKIKKCYADFDYDGAISYYGTLGEADKNNPEIKETYAGALLKKNNLDAALKEFEAMYAKNKKAVYALRIGDVYVEKAKKGKQFVDSAVNSYLEAGLLYQKENNTTNAKIALDKAKYQLFEKYGFNKKAKDYEAKIGKTKSSAQKNTQEIERLEREIRQIERRLRKEYGDLEPPDFEVQKVTKLEQQIAKLKAGGSSSGGDDAEGIKLEQEKQRIEKEYNDLLAQAKKRLGL